MYFTPGSVTDTAIDPRIEDSGLVIPNAKLAQSLVDAAGTGTYTDYLELLQEGQIVSLLDDGTWAPYVSATNGLTLADNGVLSDAGTVSKNAGINGTNMIGFATSISGDKTTMNIINGGNVYSSMMVGYEAACKAMKSNLLFS